MPDPTSLRTTDPAHELPQLRTQPSRTTRAAVLATSVVAAALADTAIAALAHAGGASPLFRPLQVPVFTAFTLIGIMLGAVSWTQARRRSQRPRALLRRLVPAVLAVTFLPDLAMLVVDYDPHSNTAGVLGLLAMHVAVAAIAVPAYRHALPLPCE